MRPRELFVISDLHIGGAAPPPPDDRSQPAPRGFRMNSRVDKLVDFIHEVAAQQRAGSAAVELVINGDFVDFLAEADPQDGRHHAFIDSQPRAVAVFDAIVQRDRPLFDALQALLASGADLTLLLGNHDLEISLPAVRARLEATLLPAPGTAGAGRLRFLYDGEAHVVGDVLIEHGNRYDGWNVVDHDRLRRLRSEASRRLDTSADARFTPPAGSTMVERVMNPIKHDYPFIDLLKPETEAALPLLLALEPSLVGVAQAAVAARLRVQAAMHAPRAPARPSQAGDIAGGTLDAAAPDPARALQDLLARSLPAAEAAALQALTEQAQAAERAQRGDIAGGVVDRVLSFLRLRTTQDEDQRLQLLLPALRALRDDRAFDRGVEADAPYLQAAEELGQGGFAVIVFGHTHLAKQVELKTCEAVYINTGTWADLIPVPAEIVSGAPDAAMDRLRDFAGAIRSQNFGGYIKHQPTYAHIVLDAQGRTQSAHLRDYSPGSLKTP